ncbi:hypothetical protein D2T29_12530 [Sinirhodobacter populi]|uniref:Uncharacterized protein n=1 Tax=Paenirhodobacter populi TaxID=2306993 RepID=A0A443KCK5_9RHOB|nr:hypothetical protein [Sinirhodobacter populi]RWR30490.1 hypothetical protein D2T29_12530 [Sinirhodobacter populi]
MTDINTQITTDGTMQVERKPNLNILMTPEAMMQSQIDGLKAENESLTRELAELRAKSNVLIRATYEDAAQIAESYRGGKRHANRMRARTPDYAEAALEARDRAMRNEGRRQAAEACNHWHQITHIRAAILALIEKEPDGKRDE